MKALIGRLLPVTIVLLLLALLWGNYQSFKLQKERLKRTEELLQQQQLIVDAFDQTFDNLQQRVSSLLDLQSGVRTDLAIRQTEIRRLQSDVHEIREWASVNLPNDIGRLRERPTVTGAAAYRQLMSHGSAVRTDGQQSENEWRLKSAD